MLNWVPDPEIHTDRGNMSACRPSRDFVAGARDELGDFRRELARVPVGQGASLFEQGIWF